MKEPEEDRQLYSQGDVWHALLALLPPGPELERRARTTGAFRRKRGVREATDLLRVALSYGFCGLSFDGAASWARANESARLCKAAVIRRIRKCGDWLEGLLLDKLSARLPTAQLGGLKVRLVDATRVAQPGSKGAAWRVHASYDPVSGRLCELFISDAKAGERLSRFTVQPGELFVGDRSYGTRPGIAHVVKGGGLFVVRTTWHHTPLERPDGSPFELFDTLGGLSEAEAGDFDVQVAQDERHTFDAVPCRLVAVRKPAEAAQAAKERILKEAKKKGRKVDPRTLEACEYFFVLTSLPREAFSAEAVLSLYRLRWQIEVEFKRLKSLLRLDDLRALTPATIRAALAAKLLGAVLLQDIIAKPKVDTQHWTFSQALYESARHVILGTQACARWLTDESAKAFLPPPDSRARLLQTNVLTKQFA
jgi:hypothetical protein